MIEHMIRFVLDQAELKGQIKKRPVKPGSLQPEPWTFSVQMPEIRSKDFVTAATTLLQTVQALATALADNAIDLDVYQEVVASLIGQYGVDVDLDAMRQRIEEDKATKAEQEPSPNPLLQAQLAKAVQQGKQAAKESVA